MNQKKKAIVLSSGGLDSSTVMAMAADQGYAIYSLSFDYGQRHACELRAAEKVAEAMGVERHLITRVDLKPIGGSALTDDMAVPKSRNESSMATAIPVTYVPARNTIFLSYALAWAEVLDAWDIFIGVNAVDYSGYPDCRPDYIQAFEAMANLATKATVEGKGHYRIHAPLIDLAKAEIIRAGTALGVDYAMTHSCYDPSPQGLACGTCDACTLRKNGFTTAGVPDPTAYASPPVQHS
ncbi:MAG: 7-cyano-7-deazaguanine synthase QueC [Desulfosarcina sp.]